MNPPRSLDHWLAHCERLHPKSMDFTLERVSAVRARLGLRFECPVISVAGTNGKGSTCALLESIARHAGYRTALHIKPHLVHFEERCLIDGTPVEAARLLPHFEAVEAARGDITLTYFEFTLLAILLAFVEARPDVVILEVGLGGRLDAVNAIDADCAVLTNVALDHTEYLGPDRESIGREKAGIFRAGKPAIVGDPEPPASVLEQARTIGADLWQHGRDFRLQGDRLQWSWIGRKRRYSGLAHPALRGANQLLNAATALAAVESLHERLPIPAQAVRTGLALVELPGRFQIVPGQPVLVLDVAHNPQAAGCARRQPGPDGLLSAHVRRVRRDGRQGHWPSGCAAAAAGGCLVRHRPAAAACGNGRRPCARHRSATARQDARRRVLDAQRCAARRTGCSEPR